jgi:hypothetical protein
MHAKIPLVVEFAPGSRVESQPAEEAEFGSGPTILPRDAMIQFADGRQVQVPADQIVLEEQEQGAARVGFGGVSFEGMVDGQLAFWRVKDIAPEETLPADRDIRFLIAPELVSSIHAHGIQVWPKNFG